MNEKILINSDNNIGEKNKKGGILEIIGVVIGFLALFALVFFSSTMRDKEEKTEPIVIDTTVTEYFDLKKAEDKSVVLFASPDCPWCVKYKPIINKVSSDYELPINYVDTSKMTRDEFTQIVTDSPYMTSKGGFGTPLTLIIGNNQEIAALEGKQDYEEVVKFFKDNGVIE